MAPPSSSSNQLAFQLSDRALTPLLSSSNSASQNHLTTAAITSYDYASRLGLGVPQRIMIESKSGPIILHTFLTPPSLQTQSRQLHKIVQQATEGTRSLEDATESHGDSHMQRAEEANESNEALPNGVAEPHLEDGDDLPSNHTKQLIVSVIAKSVAYSGEARRMAARLERIGLEIQKEAARQHTEQQEASDGDEGEG